MVRNRRRRPTGARRATFAAVALMLGGGGLVAVNVYASATEDGSGGATNAETRRAGTLDCPDVGTQLTSVPDEARAEVDKELAALDQQTAVAYQRLMDPATAAQLESDADAGSVLNPLKDERAATIERIAAAIDRVGDRPEGLDALAPCTLRKAENQADGDANDGQNQGDDPDGAVPPRGQRPGGVVQPVAELPGGLEDAPADLVGDVRLVVEDPRHRLARDSRHAGHVRAARYGGSRAPPHHSCHENSRRA